MFEVDISRGYMFLRGICLRLTCPGGLGPRQAFVWGGYVQGVWVCKGHLLGADLIDICVQILPTATFWICKIR